MLVRHPEAQQKPRNIIFSKTPAKTMVQVVDFRISKSKKASVVLVER